MITAGSPVPIAFDVRDDTGTLAHAATAALTISLPDGTTATPAITDAAVPGQYRLAYLPPAVGFYQWAAVTTGPSASYGDVFSVRAYAALIGLAEMKNHLNMTGTASDDELRNFIMCATELVESKVGPCVRRAMTWRVSEGVWDLVLPHRPLISVTSVTSVWPGGPSWTAAQLQPDLEAGIVRPANLLFPFWWGPWDVAYTVGRAVVPERFLHAGKEQVRHLWETQRGSMAPSLLAGEEVFTASTGMSFSVPRRVLELLDEDMVPSA